MSVSVTIESRPRPVSLSAVALTRSNSAAVAPAPISHTAATSASSCNETQSQLLLLNVDTPPQAAPKHLRKTSSWTTGPTQPYSSTTAHSSSSRQLLPRSSQPSSGSVRSSTATSPHSLPPLESPTRSRAQSSIDEDSVLSEGFTVRAPPALSPLRSQPSQSVSSAATPSHARSQSSRVSVDVSRARATSRAPTPSHHRQASTTAPPDCHLTLKELLKDSRPYPLTLSQFRRYMASQYTDEMVEFLLDVRQFKKDVAKVIVREEKERKVRGSSVAAVDDSGLQDEVRRLNVEKDRILQRYLVAGSEREINVSCDMRTAIEALNLQSTTCTVLPAGSPTGHHQPVLICGVPLSPLLTLFDPALREVYELIEQGKFVSRFWQQQTRNIDEHDISLRHLTGAINLTLALAIALACLLTTHVHWYRLLAWPFNFYGAMTLAIARCGVCPKLTSLSRRMPTRASGRWGWWAVVSGQCAEEECHVADAELMRETERQARWMWLRAITASTLLTVLYVAVPSHPLT